MFDVSVFFLQQQRQILIFGIGFGYTTELNRDGDVSLSAGSARNGLLTAINASGLKFAIVR